MPEPGPLHRADGLQGDRPHGGGVRQEYAGKYRYLYCADIIGCIGELLSSLGRESMVKTLGLRIRLGPVVIYGTVGAVYRIQLLSEVRTG